MPPKVPATAATTDTTTTPATTGARTTDATTNRATDAPSGTPTHTEVIQANSPFAQTPAERNAANPANPQTADQVAAETIRQQDAARGLTTVRSNPESPINTTKTSATVVPVGENSALTRGQAARAEIMGTGTATNPTPAATTDNPALTRGQAARAEVMGTGTATNPTPAATTDNPALTRGQAARAEVMGTGTATNPTPAATTDNPALTRGQAARAEIMGPGTAANPTPAATTDNPALTRGQAARAEVMGTGTATNPTPAATTDNPALTRGQAARAEIMGPGTAANPTPAATTDNPALTRGQAARAEIMGQGTDANPATNPTGGDALTRGQIKRAEILGSSTSTDTTTAGSDTALTRGQQKRAEIMGSSTTGNTTTGTAGVETNNALTRGQQKRAEIMGSSTTGNNTTATAGVETNNALTRGQQKRAEIMGTGTGTGTTTTTGGDALTRGQLKRAEIMGTNPPGTNNNGATENNALTRGQQKRAEIMGTTTTGGTTSGGTENNALTRGQIKRAEIMGTNPTGTTTTGGTENNALTRGQIKRAEIMGNNNNANATSATGGESALTRGQIKRAEIMGNNNAAATGGNENVAQTRGQIKRAEIMGNNNNNNSTGGSENVALTRGQQKRLEQQQQQQTAAAGDGTLTRGQQRRLEQQQAAATGGEAPLTTAQQRKADRIAAIEARKAELAAGTTEGTRGRKGDVASTGTPTTGEPVRPGRPVVAETPNPRPDRRAVANQDNAVATNDGGGNGKGRGRFDPAAATVPGGEVLTQRGRQFQPPGPGGEQPMKLSDIRRAQAEARLNQPPLDAGQQKWLAEQMGRMPDGRGQNFQKNFENLSPANRMALMNMDGRQQIDMISKLTRGRADIGQIEGKLGAGQLGDLKVGRTGIDALAAGAKLPLDGAKGPGTDLARALQRADVKIPGLDTVDPANKQFLADASLRLNNLKFDGSTANMKVSDALKGLDPVKVSALEKYLAGNNPMLEPGKLTFGQLDQTRLTQLQSILKGNFDLATGRPLTPQESFLQLTQTMRQTGDTNLIGKGQLPELGKLLTEQPGGRLSDLVTRTLDARTPGSTAGSVGAFDLGRFEFTSRLNPVQELHVRNLLENSSKLANLIENNLSRVDLTPLRTDGRVLGFAQVLATTLGDSRGDFTVRGDIRSMIDGRAPIVQDGGDYVNTNTAGKSQEYISKLPIDAASGLPYDPSTGKLLDPMTGRPVGDRAPEEKKSDKKWDQDDDEMDEKEKKKKKQDSDVDAEKAKQKAMLLLLQAKKKREQEIKDKALRDQKRKEEDEKRIKYICKDGDTVQSIALKQLRDSRVAALIYQINKDVIPTRFVNGEQVPVLHAGLIIWLPSPKETREFRTKLVAGSTPGAGTQPQGEKQFESVEDELAAKFGSNWSGDTASAAAAAGQQTAASEPNSIERKLMEDAMADAKRRRENIEAALGPIAGKPANKTPTGQTLYQVRLGDTLRSVAQKQPMLGDVNLWRLLAEVNGLSTEVDSKGQPTAGLSRGSKIKLPTPQEIAEYRQRIGSMAGQPMTREQRASKTCRTCGRVSVASASLCPGCGYQFGDKSVVTTPSPSTISPATTQETRDAGTVILDGISRTSQDSRRTEDLDLPAAPVPTRQPAAAPQELEARATGSEGEGDAWTSFHEFEPACRLAKSAQTWEAAGGKLVIQLQLKEETKDWYPILEYDIFETHSIRHSFLRETGAKKSVRIDLPAPAAMELAQNDLLANWTNYKKKYFA
jgi:hypothetical protein